MPLPRCSRLSFVCPPTPLVGEGGIITHQFFQIKKTAEGNQTTTCTYITQTVGHIMTSLFPQNHEIANTRAIKLS